MDASTRSYHVYGKTPAGVAALASARGTLTPSARQLLVLIDGERTAGDLSQIFGPEPFNRSLAVLEDKGYVQIVRHFPDAQPAIAQAVAPPQSHSPPPQPAPAAAAPAARRRTPAWIAPVAVVAALPALLWYAHEPLLQALASLAARPDPPAQPAEARAAPPKAAAAAPVAATPPAATAAPASQSPATAPAAPVALTQPAATSAPASQAPATAPAAPVALTQPAATSAPVRDTRPAATAVETHPVPAPPARTAARSAPDSGGAPVLSGPPPARELRVRYQVMPRLPKRAQELGIKIGHAVVTLHVTAQGAVERVELVSATPPQVYDEEMQRSFEQWTFEPPGVPGRMTVEVELTAPQAR